MTLRDRIPVEPLSDERMTNIERNVVIAASDVAARPVRARGNRWLTVAALAAVTVAVGAVSWKLGASRSSPGDIAATEAPLRVETAAEATQLDIGDARIASAPGTRFVVTRPAGGVLVDMARGKVELEVGKRGERPPLVVRAGETDVIVVGTRFSVDYGDGTGEVIVVVTEGIVKVLTRAQPDGAVRVTMGQAWTTKRGQIAIADLPSAQVAAAGTTTPAQVDRTDHDIDMPGEPAGSGARTTDRGDDAGSGSAARPGKKKTLVFEEDVHEALRKAPIQPALDIGIADPREAIQKHLESAMGRGDDAARAMYSAAFLQKRALKDNTAALRLLDIYMQRFVKKNRSEHADALWLRVFILCEKTFDDDCRRAARIYSEAAPSTSKSGIADRILASPP